jgi:hypothetical protein
MLYIAHEWVADGVFDAKQKRVLRVVRKAGGKISRSELCRKTQWLTQRERQEVIDNLWKHSSCGRRGRADRDAAEGGV